MRRVAESLLGAFWVIPGAALLAGAALGLALPRLEGRTGSGALLFGGDADAARSVLTVIATVTVSLIGLAYSVTFVAFQLASQTLSPRVLRTFRLSRLNQSTLGAFLGTAIYALIVLTTVEGGQDPFVPELSVTVAIIGTGATLALFVAFVASIARALQPATVIDRIVRDGCAVISARASGNGRRAGVTAAAWPVDGRTIAAQRGGFVVDVDTEEIVRLLCANDARGEQVAPIGHYVTPGASLLVLETGNQIPEETCQRLRKAFKVQHERTMAQDPAFAIRQLADIALRGLSPGINDPTTAETALAGMTDLLVRVARAGLGPQLECDDAGRPRLITAEPSVADLVRLGFGQVRAHVGGDAVIAARLLELLALVGAVGPGTGVADQAARLRTAFAREAPTRADAAEVDAVYARHFRDAPHGLGRSALGTSRSWDGGQSPA